MTKIPAMTVEKSKKLSPGKYEGNVLRWEYNERTINRDGQPPEVIGYADVHVAVKDPADDQAVILKAGYAVSRLTPDGKLGQLLARFGQPIKPGDQPDLNRFMDGLVNQKVTCRITSERTEKGEFSRIDVDTLSPAEAATTPKKK